jgi:single-stranded-DNA-specific exonuclease
VAADQVDAFAQAFDDALGQIEDDVAARPLLIEGECALDDLGTQTLLEIESLGPFGPGNPEPVFVFRAGVRTHQILKGRHLKLGLSRGGSAKGAAIEAIWFHAAERWDVLNGEFFQAGEGEWAGVPELNRFRGRVTPTFRVRDWRRLPG